MAGKPPEDDYIYVGMKSLDAETLRSMPPEDRWMWDDSPGSCCDRRYSECRCGSR